MSHRSILITQEDHRRLRRLADQLRSSDGADVGHVAALRHRLRGAYVTEPEQIPRNVVTMNSGVVLKDIDSGHRLTRTLAYPVRFRRCATVCPSQVLWGPRCLEGGTARSSPGLAPMVISACAFKRSSISRRR